VENPNPNFAYILVSL